MLNEIITEKQRKATSMGTLGVQLKHLHQYRRTWFYYAGLLVISLLARHAILTWDISESRLAFDLLVVGVLSGVVGNLAGGILSKPFSFCLPNLRRSCKQLLILEWITALVAYIPALLAVAARQPGEEMLVLAAAGFISLGFWLGIYFGWDRLIEFLMIALIIENSIHHAVQTALITLKTFLSAYAAWSAVISWGLCLLLYHLVTRTENIRHICGNVRYGFITPAKRKRLKQEGLWEKHPAAKPVSRSADAFPIHRKRAFTGPLATVWSGAYLYLAPLANRWKPALAAAIFLPLFLSLSAGISDPAETSRMPLVFYLALSLFFITKTTKYRPPHLFLLTPRKGLWLQRASGAVSISIAVTLLLGISILLSHILGLLPAANLMGIALKISPLDWRLLLTPIILTPLFETFFILLRNSKGVAFLLSYFSTGIVFLLFSILPQITLTEWIILFLTALVLVWWFHIFCVLHDETMNQPLC